MRTTSPKSPVSSTNSWHCRMRALKSNSVGRTPSAWSARKRATTRTESGEIKVPPPWWRMSVQSTMVRSPCSGESRKWRKKSPSLCQPSSSGDGGGPRFIISDAKVGNDAVSPVPRQLDPVLSSEKLNGRGEGLGSELPRVHRRKRRQVDALLLPLRRIVAIVAESEPRPVNPLLRRRLFEAVFDDHVAVTEEVLDFTGGELFALHDCPPKRNWRWSRLRKWCLIWSPRDLGCDSMR